jgi:hypothetical protein
VRRAALGLILFSVLLWALTFSQSVSDTTNDGYGTGSTWDSTGMYAGNSGGASLNVGTRFTNVTIAKNSTISSATITYFANSLGGTVTNVHLRIYGEAADNIAAYSNSNLPGASKTTAYAAMDPTAWAFGTGYSYTITTVVQEMVNRSGWASGNAMAFCACNQSSSTDTYVESLDVTGGAGSAYYAKLDVTYTEPAAGATGRPRRVTFQ